MTIRPSHKRRWLVPEVVQTSAMDCGPAVLKCLLEGFGIDADYGRLREACQTDVDGTSIDVLEALAGQLGLEAEQVMVPVNHVLLPEARALPAIVVVRQPNGFTHFVLAWRRHGPLVQVMDPGVGRRWLMGKQLLDDIYVHTQRVSAADWHRYALSDEFRRPLARRLRNLGLGRDAGALIHEAATTTEWDLLAKLDAAVRFTESLVRSGGLKGIRAIRGVLCALLAEADGLKEATGPAIPEVFWSALPAADQANGTQQLLFRGAVLVRVQGRRTGPADSDHEASAGGSRVSSALCPEIAAALAQPPSRPGRALLRHVLDDGSISLVLLLAGLGLAAASTVLEALLLRSTIDIGRYLGLVEQRLAAMGSLLLFAVALLFLEFALGRKLLRLGRVLEGRLRMMFLEKIPRLNDRYFHSRPTSDMAQRSHALQQIRLLPRLAGQFVRTALTLLVTAAALIWIDPRSTPLVAGATAAAIALPWLFIPLLAGLDLRVQTHAGALSRFYLDSLLGLAAVRAHGAEQAVRREHESQLVDWAHAGQRLLRWVLLIEGLQTCAGFGLAGWLLLLHAGRAADVGGMLLLAYWALNLPTLGEEMALLIRQYPMHRNLMLRLLEPLGAVEEHAETAVPDTPGVHKAGADSLTPAPRPLTPAGLQGVAVTFKSVAVHAGGHTILEDVNFHIEAGQHVAIVGASGAGKSTLVALLLGWHRAAKGSVLIDGEALDAPRLDRLRSETVWVDPAVQLWNRSLLENLLYGVRDDDSAVGAALEAADLYDVLQRLPDGLQTALGEGGGLVSGGEGQRVRFGRVLGRSQARLVILDEPFRGLDRDQRRCLLRRARALWRQATLLCITHDIGETRDFERVLVIHSRQLVEDGAPGLLAQQVNTRYHALLEAEEAVHAGLWSSTRWRRLHLAAGQLVQAESGDGK
jgi:ATP-binding cassette subfamily B protein